MSRNPRIETPLVVLWLSLHILLTGAACHFAVGSIGLPFPGLVVDPWARYSDVDAPSWRAADAGLKYPDHVVAVDDVEIPRAPVGGVPPSRVVNEAVRSARDAGRAQVLLRVDTHQGTRLIQRDVLAISAEATGFFFGIYALAGLFVLASGALVLRMSGRRPAAFAFAAWCASGHMLFTTFFDFHTSTRLVPVFAIGVLGFQAGLLWLSFLFPEPPRWAGRKTWTVLSLVTAAMLLAGVVLGAAPWLGWDPTPLQAPASGGIGVLSLVLVVSMVARWSRAGGEERKQLGIVLIGMAAIPAIAGTIFLLMAATGNPLFHVAAPFLFLVIPLSVGYSLARHDILGSSAILRRRLLVVPVVLLGAIGGAVAWLGIESFLDDGVMDPLQVLVAAGAFGTVVLVIQRASGRWLFPAAMHFRPTIEQLADRLGAPDASADVPDAIERSVSGWLPTRRVRVVLAGAVAAIDGAPEDAVTRLQEGERVWTSHASPDRHLLVPMRSLGMLRGVLDIAPKRGGALFTDEDLALLDTIASLAAVSLHNTEILRQADSLRRVELDLSRDEKVLALGVLGAQIAHEIAHPLNYFRGLIEDLGRGRLPATADVDMAHDEIDRLERMLTALRRLEPPPLHPRTVRLAESARRAAELVRDEAARRSVEVELEVEDSTVVTADPDPLLQILSNLLRNAAQHAPGGGKAGIAVDAVADALHVDVWNTGEAVEESVLPHLFKPWFTTRRGGTGLGLNIAIDLVRRLGWSIDHHREDGRTIFRITIPGAKA